MRKIKVRGLQALIPIKPGIKPKRKKDNIYYIEIRKIRLSQEQTAREKEIDPERSRGTLRVPYERVRSGRALAASYGVDKKVLKELTESVRKYGIIQPLIVAKVEKRKKQGINVYYKLVEGRKRLLAAKEAGLRVVPAKIIMNPPSLKLRRTKRNDKV